MGRSLVVIGLAGLCSCTLLTSGALDELTAGLAIGDAAVEDAADACAADACGPPPKPSGPVASCAAVPAGSPSGVYAIDPDGPSGPVAPFEAHCDLDDPTAHWTLALKIDGTADTFLYGAALWTNDETLNPSSSGMDEREAKLASFSTMPVSEVRVGMRQDGVLRWLRVPMRAPSLRALFEGPDRPTVVGRDAWAGLMNNPFAQRQCNREGFNQMASPVTVRVGIILNNEFNCFTPDSFIGLGEKSLASGNACRSAGGCAGAGGQGKIETFGYLMIR